ncbi:hypothetical protein ACFOY2_05530 [Nonomuraea purpurea]|uniref:Uncharacterized protein n=1 Tax=Nonomuraea purpurea TaxID=1849276 RepID=A0ABV8G2A5_9ACTN
MADAELREDLIQVRRDFLSAQDRLSAAGRALPAYAAVIAGEAEAAADEQREEWAAAQEECRRLAVAIQEHPYWETVEDRKAARKEIEAAAESDR